MQLWFVQKPGIDGQAAVLDGQRGSSLDEIVERTEQFQGPVKSTQERRSSDAPTQRPAHQDQPPGPQGKGLRSRDHLRSVLGARERGAVGRRDALQLGHVEARQAADGMAEFGQALDQHQSAYVVGRVQALAARGKRCIRQGVAALPDAKGCHWHAQHARHRTAAVDGRQGVSAGCRCACSVAHGYPSSDFNLNLF
jgi:hypothetical protein